ncbi:MAG: TonB-dependent receptor [Lysobacteraceae bacterium]
MTYDARFLRRPLTLALAAALVSPAFVMAQSNNSSDEQEDQTTEESQLDRITVVGSRIKRAEIEGPAPVTVITREDIDREGFTSVGDVLMSLTQQASATYSGDLGVTGFTPNAQVVNLRQLGPGFTLTLVNGRRPAQYPQPYNRDNNVVNVRAIPASIIERVEVLTGGASAIYGSDAVAGVVNIVTRENFDGNQIKGSIGTTAGGGGDRYDFEYTGGRTGDRWSAVWALQSGSLEPIFGSQRDFMADTRNNPYGLIANPALSLIAIRQSASPNGPTGHESLYPGQENCDRFGYTTVTTAARGTYCGSHSTVASRSITNAQEYYSAYGYGTFDISPTLQMFASATYFSLDAKASSGTEFWGTGNNRFLTTSTGSTTSVFFDPQLNHLVQLQRIFQPFEIGGETAATTLFDEATWDITVGMRGTMADRFDWEFYAQRSEYDYTADRPRLLAKAVHDYFLGPVLGYISGYPIHELNRDRWFSPWTPDIYRAVSTRVVNQGDTASSAINFNISGDLFELPAGPVGFAGVIEGVRQETELRSDPRLDPLRPADEQTVYNLVSSGQTTGERDRYAMGVEFRVPITSMLTTNVAARYDKYDDITAVDDAITYNFGFEFRPWERLLLRGSASTSFKAPDMQLVFAEGAASFSTVLDEYSCRSGTGPGAVGGPRTRAECNVTGDQTIYSAMTTLSGNPGLKEEESDSYGYGFVWDIIDNMSLSVDYYRIELEDAASQLSNDYILRAEAACRLGSWSTPNLSPPTQAFCDNILGLVFRQSAPGTALDGRIDRINAAYVNTALRDTSGIDSTFRYRWDTDRFGTFRLDLGHTLVLTNRYKQFPDDDLIDYRDLPPYYQRSRVRGSLSWSRGDWDATAFGTRYGSAYSYAEADGCYAPPNDSVCYSRRLAPWMVYNLTVGKRFGDNVRAQFDIVNVFNSMYRYDPSAPYPYFDSWIGADPRGRRFNFSVTYRF